MLGSPAARSGVVVAGCKPPTGLADRRGRVLGAPATAKPRLGAYRVMVVSAPQGRDWIMVSASPLMPSTLTSWATRPECGAVVTFCGTARNSSSVDHVIEALEYDTSVELAEGRMSQIAELARSRWPMLGALAIHHRVGVVQLEEPAVVIAVSSPHRHAAYEASQFCIDSVKRCVPMWKREIWAGGSAWSEEAQDLLSVNDL